MTYLYKPEWLEKILSLYEDIEFFIQDCDSLYQQIQGESDRFLDGLDWEFHNGIKILYGESVGVNYLNKIADLKDIDVILKDYNPQDLLRYGQEILEESRKELANLEKDWQETLDRWDAECK